MEMEGDAMGSALEEALRGQLRAAGNLREIQKSLMECVRKRDWVLFIKESSIMEELSCEFEALDKERSRLVSLAASSSGCADSFYAATSRFPQEKRQELNGLFRELKRQLILSKTESKAFASLVAAEKASISALIEHIVPAARAKTYDRRGSISSKVGEGLMVDAVF